MAACLPPKRMCSAVLVSACFNLFQLILFHRTLLNHPKSTELQRLSVPAEHPFGKLLQCNSVTVGKDQKSKRKYLAAYLNYQAGETKDDSRILRVTFVTFGLKKKEK